MRKSREIRVAIAGVGNCCQALLEGIEHYRQHPKDTRGLMHAEIGGYKVTDIVPVAAFDVIDICIKNAIIGAQEQSTYAQTEGECRFVGRPAQARFGVAGFWLLSQRSGAAHRMPSQFGDALA
jgi:myo-inositol-1-phosphate synthase